MAGKMSKKTRNLIIGVVFLLILAALLLVLLFGPGSNTETSEESSSSEVSTTTVELIVSTASDIKELSVENAAGGFDIVRTRVASDDSDPRYAIDELDGFTENQDEMSEIVAQFANLSATRLIEENAPDISKYGLTEPRYIIRTVYDDGTEHEVRVGNTLTTGSGAYMMIDNDTNVYAMGNTKMSRLDYTALSFLDLNVIEAWESYTDDDGNEVTAPTIEYLEVEGGTLEEAFRIEPLSAEELASQSTSYGSTFRIVKPFEADMQYKTNADGGDDNAVYTTGLQTLTADSAVMLNPSEDELAAFGLSEPFCTIAFSRDNSEHLWTVGNETTTASGAKAHYLLSNDQAVVYVVADENLPWISINIDEMYASLMLLPYINDVGQIDLMVYDKTYHFDIDEPADEDSDIVPYLDGEAIDLAAYRKMYQYFLAAPAESIYRGDKEAGTLVASFTYYYRDGGSDTVELFDLGDRICILSINGDKQWQTRIAYVQHLESNIEKLQNGETPTLDY